MPPDTQFIHQDSLKQTIHNGMLSGSASTENFFTSPEKALRTVNEMYTDFNNLIQFHLAAPWINIVRYTLSLYTVCSALRYGENVNSGAHTAAHL